jgi:hypothetical protein
MNEARKEGPGGQGEAPAEQPSLEVIVNGIANEALKLAGVLLELEEGKRERDGHQLITVEKKGVNSKICITRALGDALTIEVNTTRASEGRQVYSIHISLKDTQGRDIKVLSAMIERTGDTSLKISSAMEGLPIDIMQELLAFLQREVPKSVGEEIGERVRGIIG